MKIFCLRTEFPTFNCCWCWWFSPLLLFDMEVFAGEDQIFMAIFFLTFISRSLLLYCKVFFSHRVEKILKIFNYAFVTYSWHWWGCEHVGKYFIWRFSEITNFFALRRLAEKISEKKNSIQPRTLWHLKNNFFKLNETRMETSGEIKENDFLWLFFFCYFKISSDVDSLPSPTENIFSTPPHKNRTTFALTWERWVEFCKMMKMFNH